MGKVKNVNFDAYFERLNFFLKKIVFINWWVYYGCFFKKKNSRISLNKVDIMGKAKNVRFDEYFEKLKIIFKTVFLWVYYV